MINRVFGSKECLPLTTEDNAESQHNKIFGQGCDARLGGRSIIRNPYPPSTQAFKTWQNGWRDVDRFWGSEVKYRWQYPELGPVTY